MAQGVLNRKTLSYGGVKRPPAVSALRHGRAGAWARARARGFKRGVMDPVRAAVGVASRRAEPLGYKVWRFLCAAKYYLSAAGDGVSAGAAAAGGGVKRLVYVISGTVAARHERPGAIRRFRAALLMTGCAVLVFTYGFFGMGLEVMLDGQSLGYVNNQGEFERAVTNVNSRASEVLHSPFALNPNVTYRYSLVNRSRVFDSGQVEVLLFSRIPELKYMYVLTVDGNQIVGSRNREEIDRLLEERLETAGDSYDGSAFLQEVSVSYQIAPAKLESDVLELREILDSERRPASYAVLSGGDLTEAARGFGMSAAALLSLNPQLGDGIAPDGRMAMINRSIPLLQVVSTRVEVYDEEVPFETLYQDDAEMYTGSTELLTSGVSGLNSVTANVSYIDGFESGREVLGAQTLLQPVAEVIARGTATPPTFIKPYNGKLSSKYGMRTLLGVTRMHYGLDYSGPTGAPVVASCAGTVTFAGWRGDFGQCVIIDHGKGISTLYGHNSRLLVKPGQTVKQGEEIAKMGSTGRSTGPHVHFEIHINNKPVNPANYVS